MEISLRRVTTRKVTVRLSEAEVKAMLSSFLGIPEKYQMEISHSDFHEQGYVEFQHEFTTYEDFDVENLEDIPDEYHKEN